MKKTADHAMHNLIVPGHVSKDQLVQSYTSPKGGLAGLAIISGADATNKSTEVISSAKQRPISAHPQLHPVQVSSLPGNQKA